MSNGARYAPHARVRASHAPEPSTRSAVARGNRRVARRRATTTESLSTAELAAAVGVGVGAIGAIGGGVGATCDLSPPPLPVVDGAPVGRVRAPSSAIDDAGGGVAVAPVPCLPERRGLRACCGTAGWCRDTWGARGRR